MDHAPSGKQARSNRISAFPAVKICLAVLFLLGAALVGAVALGAHSDFAAASAAMIRRREPALAVDPVAERLFARFLAAAEQA